MSAWQGKWAIFQLFVALSYCSCMSPSTVDRRFCQCTSLHPNLILGFPQLISFPSVQWHGLQSLRHCCKVQAGSSVNLPTPWAQKKSSFVQEQKLPLALAGVDFSPLMFSSFYCCISRLMGFLSLAYTLFSCLISHHFSSCCRMTNCLQKLSQRALFCSLTEEKCCMVWHAMPHQQSGSLMLRDSYCKMVWSALS